MNLSEPEFLALQTALRGRYSIERELGRGGMGVVYLAHDVQLERPVAIKLLAPKLAADAGMRARFLREARLAAVCFHPNIVPIHSVEESGELAWFVMAYVRGESLAERVRRTGALSTGQVQQLAQDIGWALAYAHERGVVHRDVKPENILIDADSERFLLADFGIAFQHMADTHPVARGLLRVEHDATTHDAVTHDAMPHESRDPMMTREFKMGAGTPRYMAPEQARGDAIDGRADLYALGASLFHAASGRPPFDADNANTLLYQHAAMPAPGIRTLAPALTTSLADAIDQCLAKLPNERFPNAAAFVTAIKPTEHAHALPPSLRSVHSNISDAKSAVGWAVAIGGTSVLLMLGERNHSFSRDIILAIGGSIGAFRAVVAAGRTLEAAIAARRALQSGIAPEDAERALAGVQVDDSGKSFNRTRSILLVLAGAVGALVQGDVTRLDVVNHLPEAIESIVQVGLLFGPAYLIGRGAPGLLRGTRVRAWFHRWVSMPAAKAIAKVAGAFVPVAARRSAARIHIASEYAATEVRLEHAVRSAMDRLPPEHQRLMQGATVAANALAEEARRLRDADGELVRRERLARQEQTGEERTALLFGLREQRLAVKNRLSSAVAALETLRLDLLRLDADTPSGGGLTTQLGAVRNLSRRADAMAELRAYLDRSTPTPV